MVTLKTCDLCGKKISAEEIEAGEVLAVQSKTFCSECKPKVIAKIKEQKAAAAAGSGGSAPAKPKAPGRPAPPAPPKRPAPGRTAPGRPAPAAQSKPAPPKVTARKGAPPKSTKPAAERPAVGGKGAPARPAAGKAGAPRPAIGGKAPGRAPAAPGKAPGRKPAAPGRRPARAAAGVAPDGDGDEAVGFEIRKPSKAPMYIGITAVVVVVIGLLAYVMSQPDEPQTDDASVAKQEKEGQKKAAEERQRELAEEALAKAKEFRRKNPTAYGEIAGAFLDIPQRHPTPNVSDIAAEALKIAQEVERQHFDAARAAWSQIRGEAEALLAQGKFAEAEAKVQDLPDVVFLPFEMDIDGDQFAGRTLENEISAFRRRITEEVQAFVIFEELERKSKRWASEGMADVAELVLAEFDQDYEAKAPNVWRMKEAAEAKIRQEGIAGFLAAEREAQQQAEEERKAREEAERLAREQRWREKRDQVPWTNQLGRYNLYNWVINTDVYRFDESRWKIREQEGVGVLYGNNTDGNTMYIGPHTDRWQDFLLEFDVKLMSGSFEISPRTRAQVTRMGIGVADESDPIVLGDGFPTGTWVKISIEVHGDEVKWTRSDTGETIEYTGEEKRLASQGGFLFKLPADSEVEVRKVRARIVSEAAAMPGA